MALSPSSIRGTSRQFENHNNSGSSYIETPRGVTSETPRIAVVIPCFRVKSKILDVIQQVGPEVEFIFVIDDQCPEQSGQHVKNSACDSRIRLVFHEKNKGVGGAVISGYRAALRAGADIIVKLDGDGQMSPRFLPRLVAPIVSGEADYVKGNRFFSISATKQMPPVRLLGNAALSFLSKLSSGYWNIFDPTNGYTAIHRKAAFSLELEKISERYFFESDLLIHLGDIRAVVVDVPMYALYADEKSNLSVVHALGEFSYRHLAALSRRIFYLYFVRDFNLASTNLFLGLIFLGFGTAFGALRWIESVSSGVIATTGTVMLAVLPIVIGVQMILFFFSFDMGNIPRRPLQQSGRLTSLTLSDPNLN